MTGLIWIRYFAELCMYFGCALAFPKAFRAGIDPLITALVLSLSITMASFVSEKGHDKLRFLALLIPAAYMGFMCRSLGDVLIMIPAAVYTVFVIIRDVHSMDYYGYLWIFKRIMTGAAVLFVCLLLAETAFKAEGIIDAGALLKFGIVYALLGMILLKALRLGEDLKKQSWVIQIRELLVPAALVVAVAFGLLGGGSLKELLHNGLILLLTPLVMLVDLVASGDDGEYNKKRMEAEEAANSESQGGAITGVRVTPEVEQVIEEASDRSWVFAVILIVVLTVLMIALVMSVKKIRENANEKIYIVESLEEERKRKKTIVKRSGGEKIRGIYRSFLKKTMMHGVKITGNMTSQEINGEAADALSDAVSAESLRQLYLSARYDENADISEKDVKRAAEMLKNIYV